MRRMTGCLVLGVLAGCSTVAPMQTASVVDRGRLRVGGQLSAAGFCGELPGGVLGLTRCTDYPDGVPLPELRGSARVGVARGFDVGATAQVQGQLFAPERPLQVGLALDVKGELLRVRTRGPTHVVSLGLQGGGAVAGRLGLEPWTFGEWAVPLFYGLQFERWELVASVLAGRRVTVSPGLTPTTDTSRVGFTLGLFRRQPAGFAVQVGYLTDPARFTSGALQLQVGLFFDMG